MATPSRSSSPPSCTVARAFNATASRFGRKAAAEGSAQAAAGALGHPRAPLAGPGWVASPALVSEPAASASAVGLLRMHLFLLEKGPSCPSAIHGTSRGADSDLLWQHDAHVGTVLVRWAVDKGALPECA
jgi:hypothetical protein